MSTARPRFGLISEEASRYCERYEAVVVRHFPGDLCFEASGATVAAAGFCPAASGPEIGLPPSHGTGGANAESFGSGGS